jgi:hypothetical protein
VDQVDLIFDLHGSTGQASLAHSELQYPSSVVEFKLRSDHISQMAQLSSGFYSEIGERIAQIKNDEAELRLPRFMNDDAFKLGISIRKLFEKQAYNEQPGSYPGLAKQNGIVIHIDTATA